MRTATGFESSYVAMLTGLWTEMETILCQHFAGDASTAGAREQAGLMLEALLLELALLADKCEFLRWRGLLSPEQAGLARVVLDDLHALLDVAPFDSELPVASTAIVRAQNRLFDELQRIARQGRREQSQRVA